MKKNYFLIILFLCATSVFGRSATNIYRFYAPDISKLLPLSHTQTKLLKELNIFSFSEGDSRFPDCYSIHYLNKKGLVESTKYICRIKKKGKLQGSFVESETKYEYDSLSRLIYKKYFMKNYIHIDSITYDHRGVVSSYHSYSMFRLKSKQKYTVDQYYSLTLLKSSDWGNILTNQSDTLRVEYSFNKENKIIKCIRINQIDSVSYTKNSENTLTKKYYYKTPLDSVYYIGLEQEFQDEKIILEKCYVESTEPYVRIRSKYFYDENDRLIRVSDYKNDKSKRILTYTAEGLLNEEVIIEGKDISRKSYVYEKY